MGRTGDDVRLRILASTSARDVAEPVLLALGARAGLDVERLDELAVAFGLVVGAAAPGPVAVGLLRLDQSLTVTVSPIDADRLRRRRSLLDELTPVVAADGDRIDLRVCA